MAVKIGHASISENGTIRGTAGDQTGKEVCTRTWYKHSKGWYTLRCKNTAMRCMIAEAMEKACANPDIGYDQLENGTLWDNVKGKGFDPSKTTKKVETDCARLVRVCCQYACEKVGNGKTIPDFYTATLASTLVKTGLFEKLTSDKYCKQDNFLMRGDIQVTRSKGHTWVCLTNGDKTGVSNEPEKVYKLGERTLKNGSEGDDVKDLQECLINLGYDCGTWGADGDFGDATELAVKEFQEKSKVYADGIYGPKTHAAMQQALEDADKAVANPRKVRIVGGNCYVRSEPNTGAKILGVAKRNDVYDYGGIERENGWHLINYKNNNAWVSGKYSELEG